MNAGPRSPVRGRGIPGWMLIRGLIYIAIGIALALWADWLVPSSLAVVGGAILTGFGVRYAWKAFTGQINRGDVEKMKDPFMWG